MTDKPVSINIDRLRRDVEALAAIGRGPDQGIYRMAFSEGDLAGRRWLQSQIEAAHLDYFEDGAANQHGRLAWDGQSPSIMIGSHLDTVPGGGPLDGALGVLVGLEILRSIQESETPLRHPMEVVNFTDEEGRFGGLFGSQAMAGQLTPAMIHEARDLEGVSLTEAMAAWGMDANAALFARRPRDAIKAYLELHIEQGPVLDRGDISIGVVEAITGLFKWEVTLKGQTNHAGTTPMHMRQDSFQGLAEFAFAIDRILEEHGSPHSRATIGRVELSPGAANTVPGSTAFSLDVRDTDADVLSNLSDAFRRTLSALARRRQLMFEFEVLSEITPQRCDAGLVQLLSDKARALDLKHMCLPSGAAHDAQIMASMTRTGMVFVPSIEGRSHSAAEWTNWEDIERGANVLLQASLSLAVGTGETLR
ncbi:N-carbamoyl-L-amino-acid hydrolase [Ectothiorhodosinus mongolicus]|uniref:N-carbamoyl-L-amino-acid hydrolase n=1 Tax=Ectothiorhodosinus mongolicus TaxID=233100 RepID=A0A1R3VVR9_9GAMM|nr:Zn-dependent hydrolase [Ectothiorhodosinus mongolicus]ULX56950.1 Zn-dependent hydrolase [Ectothiorhodosinus mongolicus]SIT69145.1 N-carbamoyl-L-amino-acid hydrolase [Ectothiorhodosinus mongolicus]